MYGMQQVKFCGGVGVVVVVVVSCCGFMLLLLCCRQIARRTSTNVLTATVVSNWKRPQFQIVTVLYFCSNKKNNYILLTDSR